MHKPQADRINAVRDSVPDPISDRRFKPKQAQKKEAGMLKELKELLIFDFINKPKQAVFNVVFWKCFGLAFLVALVWETKTEGGLNGLASALGLGVRSAASEFVEESRPDVVKTMRSAGYNVTAVEKGRKNRGTGARVILELPREGSGN